MALQAATLLIMFGILTAIFGGLTVRDQLLGVGGSVAALGVCLLWVVAIWKRPIDALVADAKVEAVGIGLPLHEVDASHQGRVAIVETSGDPAPPNPSLPCQ